MDEAREDGIPWKKWGPYLSERQWGGAGIGASHQTEWTGLIAPLLDIFARAELSRPDVMAGPHASET